jgi:glycosyltransferase involved in cell wall biosynthesis
VSGRTIRKKRVLYLGLAHGARDTRLAGLLAAELRKRYPGVECLYLGIDSREPVESTDDVLQVVEMPRGLNPAKPRFRLHDLERMARHIGALDVDLVQVSDVRELALGYLIRKTTQARVIYDSHEDYFNQKYEYSGKSPKGLFNAIVARAEEILFVRYMDAVFCTDSFLETFYRLPIFASKSVTMVRNLPMRSMINGTPVLHERDALELVYIGSVNAVRGVVETADYCARFNAEPGRTRGNTTLSFHVFSNANPIVDRLVREEKIEHHGYLKGPALEDAVRQFDIGVSLLQPTTKFHRNIPMKNFEYMALGIPILTSNFGPMKKYVGDAGAGVLIDPTDYRAFRDAILELKDRDFRKACGERGLAFARENFDREAEVAPYLDTVGALLGLTKGEISQKKRGR